jgi:hypothetical protein
VKRLILFLVFLPVFPLTVLAGVAQHFDQPDTAFASNVAVDIIRHGNAVWLATSRGINYTYDNGATWLLYNSANGLPGDDISALFSMEGRLWAATSHLGTSQGSPISLSDGLSYSDDNGILWHHVPFDSLTPPVLHSTGAYRTVYDLAGWHDVQRSKDWLFACTWAGGFLVSQDNGAHWRRIFTSPSDSANFTRVYNPAGATDSLYHNNMAFSCVVDTSHGDSLFVWEGTVGGVFQQVFVPRQDKFGSRRINAINISSLASPNGGHEVFYGGSAGVVRGRTKGGPYISRDTANSISAISSFGGKIFWGTFDPVSGEGRGLGISSDTGNTFVTLSVPAFVGADRRIVDFAAIGSRLYLAAQESGLFVSTDTGATWSHLWVDSADTSAANLRNSVYALYALADTLRIGTDSGLVTLFLNPAGHMDSSRSYVFPQVSPYYPRVVKIRRQQYGLNDTLVSNDSTALWVITRSPESATVPSLVNRSADGGINWGYFQQGVSTNDLGFVGDTTLFVSEYGVRRVSNALDVYGVRVKDASDSTLIMSDSLPLHPHDSVLSIAVFGDTVIMGGDSTVAISTNRMKSFRVFKPNLDSLKADLIINYSYVNSLNIVGSSLTTGLAGDFVPAMGIQYVPGSPARIYASGRPAIAGYGVEGVSYGRVVLVIDTTKDTLGNITSIDTTGHRYRWDQITNMPTFVWNFDHAGDTLYLPSDSGLFLATGIGTADSAVAEFTFQDTLNREVISPRAAVYTARIIDSFIWVGSDEGTIRIRRGTPADQRLTRVIDGSSEVFAYPTPFSPQEGERVDFHFSASQAGNVTIEIYDFALNLVARPIDHVYYSAGVHPGTNEVGLRKWDGRNGRGDVVAVGVYYIKVISSNGDVKWGKLAVIP